MWTILIPTLGQRTEMFRRLLNALMPQVDAVDGAVRVIAWCNNGSPKLAEIRQELVMSVQTEYMSFVDDDDLVSPYFVEKTLDAMHTRTKYGPSPDYIGWKTQYYVDGAPICLVVQGIHVGPRWYGIGDTLYRDITHINPVRTVLARRADFRRIWPEQVEDRAWVRQMRPHIRTQVFIDEVMYHYLYSESTSAWRRPDLIDQGPFDRVEVDSPYFTYHPKSA